MYFNKFCIVVCRFGPMVRTWCMRYEAKHRYFKRLAGFMGNFTNVSYTLAERHQAKMCYTSNSGLKPKDMTIGKGFMLYFIEIYRSIIGHFLSILNSACLVSYLAGS